jgi:hypothetical protein
LAVVASHTCTFLILFGNPPLPIIFTVLVSAAPPGRG